MFPNVPPYLYGHFTCIPLGLSRIRSFPNKVLSREKLTNVTFSTPIGTLHWFLAKFHASWRASICITHGAYLLHYAVARVYLLYYILKIYGAWTGQSAVESFAHLHRPCQIGTGVIGVSNAVWLVLGLRKFIRKYL